MKILAYPAYKNKKLNPYNYLLYTNLIKIDSVEVDELDFYKLIFNKYDIVHIHWPEYLVRSRFVLNAVKKTILVLLSLSIAKFRGSRLIWTAHNFAPHEYKSPTVEKFFLKIFLTNVDGIIHPSQIGKDQFSSKFPKLSHIPSFIVPLGNYVNVYKNDVSINDARVYLGIPHDAYVITFFGLIRPYKNVDLLIEEFIKLKKNKIYLVIVGMPTDNILKVQLLSSAENHSNIITKFSFVDDDEVQYYLNSANLIVLPFHEIQNSGSALLALSFYRPVLVPNKGAMSELRELVGPEWVMTYEGELTSEIINNAISWAVRTERPEKPDLTATDWDSIALKTINVYNQISVA